MTPEQQLRDEFRATVIPWLGECEIFCWRLLHKIHGHGFAALSLFTYPDETRPAWIKPKWRKDTGVNCPRCGEEIEMLLKNYRTGTRTHTGKPFIFCGCVRLHPSRLPNPAFFTDNWPRILKIVDLAERLDQLGKQEALALETQRSLAGAESLLC